MEIQWSLVLFTSIAGAGAALFAFLCLSELRGQRPKSKTVYASLIFSIVLMGIGGISSMTHIIHHLDRIMAVLTHPAQGIFLEALMLGLTCALVIVYGALVYREVNERACKIVAAIGLVVAVIFTFVCGFSYMMGSRPVWNSILLPLGYTGTVLVAGAGIYLALLAYFKEPAEFVHNACLYLAVTGVIALLTGGAYGLVSGVAFGEYAWMYWLLVVLINAVVPFVAGLYAYRKNAEVLPMGIIGSVAGIVGSSGYRVLMWAVGVAIANCFGVTI